MRRVMAVLAMGALAAAAVVLILDRTGARAFRITVVEGLTVAQTLESLAEQTRFEVGDLTDPLLDGSVTSPLLPYPPGDLQDWEGLLFPDTYEVTDRFEAADILQLLADTAVSRVASIDWSGAEGRGMTPYQGIVIASMIERETHFDEERPIVASVIYNRLEIGMPLQIDATVIYALGGNPPGGLTYADLEVDSPYNTYRTTGLPPTPISGVGAASLAAAANPAETEYLFYVFVPSAGRHLFTDDFDEFREFQRIDD